MKRVKVWLSELFNPERDLDVAMIAGALNDAQIRMVWFNNVLREIKQMNVEVDKRLLSGNEYQLTDLCARRKAYRDVLETVLSAKRQVTQEVRHNPTVEKPIVNLDRVTA